MILTPIMKDPEAEGIISRQSPHAINNILVDDLGRDEILLLATDSGNVCGYHVESIFSHIESAISNGEQRPILDTRIDPFFCESVGLSAWGLAVHKYARLIAISSNTGIITVFAFAIADESDGEPSSHSESFIDDFQNYGQNWLHIDDAEQFEKFRQLIPTNKHRSRNVRLSYKGHFTNIPCIDFLSSDLDSEGMWMVSTDIDNRVFVWAIWDQFTPFKKFEFYRGEPLPDVLRAG
jgi:CRT10